MKITYDQYAYIKGYKHNHVIEKYAYNFYITVPNFSQKDYNCKLYRKIKRWLFILLFLPVNLINIIIVIICAILDMEWFITIKTCDAYDSVYAVPEQYPSSSNRAIEVLKEYGVYNK